MSADEFYPVPEHDAWAEGIVEDLCQQIGLAAFRKVAHALFKVCEADNPDIAMHATAYFARGIMGVSAAHATEPS
jgi:hypothetical protein